MIIDEWTEPMLQDEMKIWLDELQADFGYVEEWVVEPAVCTPNSSDDSLVKSKRPRVKKSAASKTVNKIPVDKIVVKMKQSSSALPLLAFPSFDRSDATIYFASTYARLSNNGDDKALEKLFANHCAKDLMMELRPEFVVPVAQFIDMRLIVSTLYPDIVHCMHSTKVVGNQIIAVLYSKHTDAADMYDYHDCIVDAEYKRFFAGTRRQTFDRRFNLKCIDENKRKAVYKLLDAEATVQVYSRLDLTLTLHPRTKKIIECSYLSTYTSLLHENVHYPVV